jgi:hypothetical protein
VRGPITQVVKHASYRLSGFRTGLTTGVISCLMLISICIYYISNLTMCPSTHRFSLLWLHASIIQDSGASNGNPGEALLEAVRIADAHNISAFIGSGFTSDQQVIEYVATALNKPHLCGFSSSAHSLLCLLTSSYFFLLLCRVCFVVRPTIYIYFFFFACTYNV